MDTTFCTNGLLDEVKDNGVSGNAIAHYEYIGENQLTHNLYGQVGSRLSKHTLEYEGVGRITKRQSGSGTARKVPRLTWEYR